ncbi:MAG: GTPase Era [Clostridia bacterium]|nr:GTPase Era [Clostridia bacterium]
MEETKSGFIAIVGRPNAGKSTILNRLCGAKIAITTPKPQTTRTQILGILHGENYQMVFVDTPGIHLPKTRLGTYMNHAAIGAIESVDAAILAADASRGLGAPEERIMEELRTKHIPAVLALNKIDLVQPEALLPQMAAYAEKFDFTAIIPLSAKTGDGAALLLEELEKFLAPGPFYYPEDMITDKTEREIMAEFIREKLLQFLEQEIPHGIAVEILEMKDTKGATHVSANIICEKSSHKSIIIGKGGSMMKRVGRHARLDAEEFFGKKIYLQLWVKVKDDWRNSNFMLKSLGFTEQQ